MNRAASTLDALRAFYIAEKLMRDIIHSSKKDEKELRRRLVQAVKKVKKMPKKKLLAYATDQWGPRFDNYFNSRWELRHIPLNECGVWPRMGKLPNAATNGTVMDTAEYLRPYLSGKKRRSPRMKRVFYIEKLRHFAEIITEYVPIIVFEGGVIRHNKLRTEVERKQYKRCRYDIDDGNHRAVSLALHGKKEILALVGTRTYKSELLYF